jgi:FMN phosphatase YigB (HAD superfamily)
MVSHIAQYCQMEVSDVEKALKEHHWSEAYEQGEIDSWTLFHKLPKAIQGSKGFAGWMEAISNIFKPNDALVSLVKKLKQEHIRLFTLSNICEAHFGYAYTHFPVLHLFDGHILSYEVKARAPDSKIYEEALLKACTEKENSFYVSASREYVKKAKELQIDSELYANPEAFYLQLKQKKYLP